MKSAKILPDNFSWLKDGSLVNPNLWSSKSKSRADSLQNDADALVEGCVGIDAYSDFMLNDLKCDNLYAFYCEHDCLEKPKPFGRLYNGTYIKEKIGMWFSKITVIFSPDK